MIRTILKNLPINRMDRPGPQNNRRVGTRELTRAYWRKYIDSADPPYLS